MNQPVNEDTECAYDYYNYENPETPQTGYNKPKCGFGEHGYHYCPALKGDDRYQAYLKAAKEVYSHDMNCHIHSKPHRCPDFVKYAEKNDYFKLQTQANYVTYR